MFILQHSSKVSSTQLLNGKPVTTTSLKSKTSFLSGVVKRFSTKRGEREDSVDSIISQRSQMTIPPFVGIPTTSRPSNTSIRSVRINETAIKEETPSELENEVTITKQYQAPPGVSTHLLELFKKRDVGKSSSIELVPEVQSTQNIGKYP